MTMSITMLSIMTLEKISTWLFQFKWSGLKLLYCKATLQMRAMFVECFYSMMIQVKELIVMIYLFWKLNNWTNIGWHLINLVPNLTKMKNSKFFQCQFWIWKWVMIWSLKFWFFECFNYLIWCDTKNVELKLKFGLDNWKSLSIQLFEWIL